MLRHTFTIWTGQIQIPWEHKPRTVSHTIEYRLSPRPFKLMRKHELPKSHELDSWETDEDVWFRYKGSIYNVKEFCTHGMRVIPGPNGGAQTASNGYFMIAGYDGKIYSVSCQEVKDLFEERYLIPTKSA